MINISKILSSPYTIAPNRSIFYLILWIAWIALLWFLSSRSPSSTDTEAIFPHIDKLLHFGYFACGAILVAGFWLTKNHSKLTANSIMRICLFTGAVIGALDEFHQSYIPGRFGNCPYDFTADVLGSFTGAAYMIWIFKYQANAKAIRDKQ